MKYIGIIFIVIVVLSFEQPVYSSFQPTKAHPFTLQRDYINSILEIFTSNSPVSLILEVNVSSQNGNAFIRYFHKFGNNSSKWESKEIFPHTYYNLTLVTDAISLVSGNRNSNLVFNYSTIGLYRIHQGQYNPTIKWYPYNLSLCTPESLTIFDTNSSWFNSLRVNITVTQIYGGFLGLSYSQGDYYQSIEITKIGIYTYNLTTSALVLSLSNSKNYSKISGFYYIFDQGHAHQNSANGFQYFPVLLAFFAVIVVKKRKSL